MHPISSTSNLSLNDILTKQIKPLRQQLTQLFTKYPIDLGCRFTLDKEIQRQFMKSFSVPIPSSLEQRVLYEKQIIGSLRYQLKRDQLILRRTADENNVYYLGSCHEFNTMAQNYLANTKNFEMIGIIDEINTEQKQLTNIIRSIDLDLDQLERQKIIPMNLLTKFQIGKKPNIILPYLYFLPETYPDGHIILQPRLSSSKKVPIQTLATYLHQLLRPLYDKSSPSTTFLNGADFIQKIQEYCIQKDTLLPRTKFVTFQMHHLYSTISHEDILTALNQLLVTPINEGQRHQRLTSDAIEKLTKLVLSRHIFTYNGKIYRYLKGLPLNMPLTELLCNIYLHYWQLPLVRQIRVANGFYSRYRNIGLMTCYEPNLNKLQTTLNELKQQHPNIEISTSIGSTVNFLNATLENKNGNLYSYMYHDPSIQPFLLPYISNHPRLGHRQWFRFALIRAGLYCVCYEDFEEERVHIEITFLTNGYSLAFVQDQLQQFFKRFNPSSSVQQPMDLNRSTYTLLRTQLFRHFRQQKLDLEERKELENKHQLIELYYLYDWGSRHEFNQQFYKLWTEIINKDPTFLKHGLKIILSSKHCFLSNTLLVQYKTN